MKKLLLVLSLSALLPAAAMADWCDGFEDYVSGSGLHGQGGWAGWEGNSAYDALISNRYAHTGSNSVAIAGASDMVHEFTGYTSGQWVFSAWQYIPTSFTGETYFILLNQYGAVDNWSVQVHWVDGQVIGDSVAGASLPWILGQWVELRLEIDLDADVQTFYYGGQMLYTASWREGVSGGGISNIAAVDLYANNASAVYYDDVCLQGVVGTESTTWGTVKALFQ